MITIIVGIACFAAGGVCTLMFQGATLKDAIAKEIAALKADFTSLKDRLDPSAAAQTAAPTTKGP